MNKEEIKHLSQSYYDIHKKYDKLKKENERLDKVNCKLRKTNEQLKDNWNYIKKMLKEARQEKFNVNGYCGTCTDVDIDFLLDKIQELEKSDNNE